MTVAAQRVPPLLLMMQMTGRALPVAQRTQSRRPWVPALTAAVRRHAHGRPMARKLPRRP